MKKQIAAAFFLSALFSDIALADTIFLSLDGDVHCASRTVTYRLQDAGFQVAPVDTMAQRSGVIIRLVNSIDLNTTGQGNSVANHGGSATAIYMCQTKTARIPIYLGDLATTGVSLGYEANSIRSQAEKSLAQIATLVLKRTATKSEEWATYCANLNAAEVAANQPTAKKKK